MAIDNGGTKNNQDLLRFQSGLGNVRRPKVVRVLKSSLFIFSYLLAIFAIVTLASSRELRTCPYESRVFKYHIIISSFSQQGTLNK